MLITVEKRDRIPFPMLCLHVDLIPDSIGCHISCRERCDWNHRPCFQVKQIHEMIRRLSPLSPKHLLHFIIDPNDCSEDPEKRAEDVVRRKEWEPISSVRDGIRSLFCEYRFFSCSSLLFHAVSSSNMMLAHRFLHNYFPPS